MFFLGSVTRYNPYFFDTLMDEKEQWLISEFLNTQPKQFLYELEKIFNLTGFTPYRRGTSSKSSSSLYGLKVGSNDRVLIRLQYV